MEYEKSTSTLNYYDHQRILTNVPRNLKTMTQFLLPIWVLSTFIYCSHYFSSSCSRSCSNYLVLIMNPLKFYLSAIPLHALDKSWIFLICNIGILMVLATTSTGFVSSPSMGSSHDDYQYLMNQTLTSTSTTENVNVVELDQDHDQEIKWSAAGGQIQDVVLSRVLEGEEEEEKGDDHNHQEIITLDVAPAENVKLESQEYDIDDQRFEEEEKERRRGSDHHHLISIEEIDHEEAEAHEQITLLQDEYHQDNSVEEITLEMPAAEPVLPAAEEEVQLEEDEDRGEVEEADANHEGIILEKLSAEELNKKFDDFIRKMKEELRIEPAPQRHLVEVK